MSDAGRGRGKGGKGVKAGSVRDAFLKQISRPKGVTKTPTRRRVTVTPLLRDPLMKLLEPLTDTRLRTLTKGTIKSAQWRIPTTTGSFQRWASGADETVATRIATSKVNKTKSATAKLALAQELNQHRVDNSQLIWRTETGEIAGHVPAIKNNPKDVRRSVTTEHGRRDRSRGSLVSSAFDLGPEARHVTATASTIGLMMSPGEHLLTATPSKPTFANYSGIGNLQSKSELTKLASEQQEVREHHKIGFAEFLTAHGRKSEVPAEYHPFVGKGASPSAVRSGMVGQMEGTHPTIKPNRSTTSLTDLTPTSSADRFKRSLSPPRGRITTS